MPWEIAEEKTLNKNKNDRSATKISEFQDDLYVVSKLPERPKRLRAKEHDKEHLSSSSKSYRSSKVKDMKLQKNTIH